MPQDGHRIIGFTAQDGQKARAVFSNMCFRGSGSPRLGADVSRSGLRLFEQLQSSYLSV